MTVSAPNTEPKPDYGNKIINQTQFYAAGQHNGKFDDLYNHKITNFSSLAASSLGSSGGGGGGSLVTGQSSGAGAGLASPHG